MAEIETIITKENRQYINYFLLNNSDPNKLLFTIRRNYTTRQKETQN